ncbi:dihydropteroate synthase [Kiloniella spongiae]|uniref:Dihydropteroate synthase n=1 Tax=Kiloniella spongiae TaxID=1489064 RepID=A0A0H2MIU4_9PROT|nr:dihydropteroate synthase [Kiloniella spongiae]KLN62101.1 dihydropteroate synthase [Kiloniella spongiae]
MSDKLYIRPVGISPSHNSVGKALPFMGIGSSFAAAEVTIRSSSGDIRERHVLPTTEILPWLTDNKHVNLTSLASDLLATLGKSRPSFAGLDMSRPHVMAVINVTPDSFSDGGDRYAARTAVEDGLHMIEKGATILDIGGESTRPGADPVTLDEELRRVIPVVEKLTEAGALVSIDTRHAKVMTEAVQAGAAIINDVTALEGDAESLEAAAKARVPVILMHMQGTPETMQANPQYQDVALDIYDYLQSRVQACLDVGIPKDMIAVDPGIGFGKTVDHNLRLLDTLSLLHGIGCPVLLGVSRKNFIGKLSQGEEPKDRVAGSLACALAGLDRGVQMYRVHDVAETSQAFAIGQAIKQAV